MHTPDLTISREMSSISQPAPEAKQQDTSKMHKMSIDRWLDRLQIEGHYVRTVRISSSFIKPDR